MAFLKDRFDVLLDKAKSGDVNAQYRIAAWLYKGHLVEQKLEAAKYWAFKAINNGNKKAEILFEKLP